MLYLVLFEGPVDQEGGLLLHPLYDRVGHSIVRLGAGLSRLNTVLIIHILLGRPATEDPTLIVHPIIKMISFTLPHFDLNAVDVCLTLVLK